MVPGLISKDRNGIIFISDKAEKYIQNAIRKIRST